MSTDLYLFIIFVSVLATLFILILIPSMVAAYQEQPLSEKQLKRLNSEQQDIVKQYLSNHTEPLTRSAWNNLWYDHKQFKKAEKNKIKQDKFFSSPSS